MKKKFALGNKLDIKFHELIIFWLVGYRQTLIIFFCFFTNFVFGQNSRFCHLINLENGICIKNNYEFKYEPFKIYNYSEPVYYYKDNEMDVLNLNAIITNKKSKNLFNHLHFCNQPISKGKLLEGFVYVGTIKETDSFKFQIFKVKNFSDTLNVCSIVNLFLVKVNKNSNKIVSLINVAEYFDNSSIGIPSHNIYLFNLISSNEVLVEIFFYKSRIRIKNIPQNIKYNLITIEENSELSIKILKD